MWAMVSVALRAPVVVGAKRAVAAHDAPGNSVEPALQVVEISEKSLAETTALLISSGALPVLLSVTLCPALSDPTVVSAKASVAVVAEATGDASEPAGAP